MKDRSLNKILKPLRGKDVPQIKKAICGERIGKGASRTVYIFKPDDRFVVKVEKNQHAIFANITEWRNYCDYSDTSIGKWLAPCHYISPDGKLLIQSRAIRVIDGAKIKYPKQIPACMTDTHKKNFGILDGNFVCFDYPFLIIDQDNFRNVRWRKG